MPDSPSEPVRRQRGRPKAFDDRTEQNTIRALDRAMVVLEALSRHEGIALSALADALDQSPATVYRVLTTLQLHGICEFDEAEQHWHVGPGAYRIGSAFLRRTSVVDRSRPILRQLMQETGETANLGVERADMVLFVSQVETHASIRAFFPPGTQSPMHASGIGKALLAFYDAPRLRQWLQGRVLEGFTPSTLTDEAALLEDLARIRMRGVSLDNEERTPGMRCIAAPIFNAFGEPVAGVSISGPAARMDDAAVDGFGALVRVAARTISEAVGGRVPETLKR
ncbi:IclR family transcriptional regulator [Halovulum dunhuangense]|uniref:IclR family transcriptional regulator n=1 Tax=Halovulum dunhuangense TaxID=1505036 RepID=A0A849L4L9_9RHOB|nr:HTH-type transcriptional regulator BhcR [Halovulum dunhuangense]NNU81144.1 IclR family transcriptional regulator [Halovulum dunhuangense]